MIRKDANVKVRLTPAEQERAQRLAALAGCSVSEMIRRLVADARVVVRPSVVEVEHSTNSNAGSLVLADAAGIAR